MKKITIPIYRLIDFFAQRNWTFHMWKIVNGQ